MSTKWIYVIVFLAICVLWYAGNLMWVAQGIDQTQPTEAKKVGSPK